MGVESGHTCKVALRKSRVRKIIKRNSAAYVQTMFQPLLGTYTVSASPLHSLVSGFRHTDGWIDKRMDERIDNVTFLRRNAERRRIYSEHING